MKKLSLNQMESMEGGNSGGLCLGGILLVLLGTLLFFLVFPLQLIQVGDIIINANC
jgi:hypothetical protein